MKTTKTHVEPVSSVIQYQLRKGIKSITVGGKSDLMDLEIDKKGNVTLVMNADKDKLDVEKFEEYKNAFIDFINEYDKELFKYLNNKEWILKTDTPNLITISYEPTDDPDINKTVLNILHDDTKLNIKDFEKFVEDNEQIINTIQEMVANHTENLTRLETTTDTLTITLNDTIAKTTDNTNAITENKTSIDELKEKTQKLETEKASLKDLNNLSETVENDIQIVREKTVLNDTNIKELEKEVNTNKDNIIEVKENINEIVNNFETIENDLDAHKKAVKDNLKVNNLKLDDLENIAQEIVEKIDNVKKVEVVGNNTVNFTVQENEKTIVYTVNTENLEYLLNGLRNDVDTHAQYWNNLQMRTETPDLIAVEIDTSDVTDYGYRYLKVSASENLIQKIGKVGNIKDVEVVGDELIEVEKTENDNKTFTLKTDKVVEKLEKISENETNINELKEQVKDLIKKLKEQPTETETDTEIYRTQFENFLRVLPSRALPGGGDDLEWEIFNNGIKFTITERLLEEYYTDKNSNSQEIGGKYHASYFGEGLNQFFNSIFMFGIPVYHTHDTLIFFIDKPYYIDHHAINYEEFKVNGRISLDSFYKYLINTEAKQEYEFTGNYQFYRFTVIASEIDTVKNKTWQYDYYLQHNYEAPDYQI